MLAKRAKFGAHEKNSRGAHAHARALALTTIVRTFLQNVQSEIAAISQRCHNRRLLSTVDSCRWGYRKIFCFFS